MDARPDALRYLNAWQTPNYQDAPPFKKADPDAHLTQLCPRGLSCLSDANFAFERNQTFTRCLSNPRMDWLRSDDTLWEKNMSCMDFEPAECTVLLVAKLGNTDLRAQKYTIQSEEDWQAWLDQHACPLDTNRKTSIRLILGARADTGGPDPGVLFYLPFSEPTFRKLIGDFKIHGTIVRTINRNIHCAFIRKFHSGTISNERSIVYNCRSSASWEGDLGLSITFNLQTLTTHAIIYGCDAKTTEEITNRVSTSDVSSFHPMVLVVLFAELERNRLDRLVRNNFTQLYQQIVKISGKHYASTLDSKSISSQPPTLALSIRDWIQMGALRNELQAFKRKMCDMMEHLDEFQEKFLNLDNKGESFAATLDPDTLSGLKETGVRMKERLKYLVDEFDELIRKCANIIDGVGLASQLEWNQIGRQDTVTNLKIADNGLKVARHTRRDSELMKSIALLTMVFLPATFVATLFSMGIFEWKGSHGETLNVSPYIWLYVVVTVVITSVTLGTWYIWAIRRGGASSSSSSSANSGTTGEDVEAQRAGQDEKEEVVSPASTHTSSMRTQ